VVVGVYKPEDRDGFRLGDRHHGRKGDGGIVLHHHTWVMTGSKKRPGMRLAFWATGGSLLYGRRSSGLWLFLYINETS
jgi:hypothetical protein